MIWSRRNALAAMAGLAGLALTGGAAAQSLVRFPQSRADILTQAGKRYSFSVELASTLEQLTQGLMYRRALAADAGMLFDFGTVKPVSMWMRNTLIPLDMLFLAADGRVVGIHERAVPGSLEVISAPEPVLGVLEVNSGTVERLGLSVGDRISHPLFAGR
ncbi:MAG: DUF192 domain-containing protein [Magnetospirillum sp.]|nr:DUF192 domain-containing protein [Magnetospirillum sp.]